MGKKVGTGTGSTVGSAVGSSEGNGVGSGTGSNVGIGEGTFVAAQQLPHSAGQSQNNCRVAVPAPTATT
jgi:hypothetical protein